MTYLSRSNDVELTGLDISIPHTVAHVEQLPALVGNVVAMPKAKREAAETYTFDYSGVSAAVAKEAEATAKRIRDRLRTQTIETGKELQAIKKALGHGKFGKWLEYHFGWKERTAQNYMNSVTAFGSTPHIIDMLPPSTVYKLAAKSVPSTQVQEFLAQKIVGHLKKRFGDKFSHLRAIILKIDIAVLRKALSEA